jgi:hypothetical protein
VQEIRDALDDKIPNLVYSDADFEHAINLYPCFYKHEWGTDNCTNNIILHLIAHLITRYQQQTAEGVSDTTPARIQSTTVGSVSITYAVQALSPKDEAFYADFSATIYGKLFLSMISRQPVVRGLFV